LSDPSLKLLAANMDSDHFKRIAAPYLTAAIDRMGGIDRVRELSRDLPEQTIYFVAGVTYGLAANDARPRFDSHEEMRRLLDLVRLRIETESTSS
jgi:hypothetical protein